MINVFFVPGMFGSTIEYVLRSYTKEHTPIIGKIRDDGSMHSFDKEYHPASIESIKELITLTSTNKRNTMIATPMYPFKSTHLSEILKLYSPLLENNHSILLYTDSIRHAELNMLFQYYKIAVGKSKAIKDLGIFCGDNLHNIVNWNSSYTSWKDMQRWELREWLSLFYEAWVQEWIDSQNQVPKNFLKITNTELLFDTKNVFLKIFKFCNLTSQDNIDSFILEWQQKQQYIVEEFNLLDRILEHTINQYNLCWGDLNIISEAIIQKRLREKGFDIRCDGLNTFPTDSISLYNLLEKH